MVEELDGQLQITPPADAPGPHFNGYMLTDPFDLTATSASVEVVRTTEGATETIFSLVADIDNYFSFVVSGADVSAGVASASVQADSNGDENTDTIGVQTLNVITHAGAGIPAASVTATSEGLRLYFITGAGESRDAASVPYDSVQHRFWRFRYDTDLDVVFFETSPDRATWTRQRGAVSTFPVKTVTAELSAGTSLAVTQPGVAAFDNFLLEAGFVQLGSASYAVAEDGRNVAVTVTRSGDTSGAATVDYTCTGDTASERSDFTFAKGTLRFAPGETEKTFSFVTDDRFVEGAEAVRLHLLNPSGVAFGTQTSATIAISDNDDAPSSTNPADDARFFVRQHYLDFLNREPDEAGLQFWTTEITACGADTQCVARKREFVSAAFFLSIEFQQTGFLVHRFYKTAFGRAPRLVEFLPDAQRVGRDVVVGSQGWEEQVAANQRAFAEVSHAARTSACSTTVSPTSSTSDKLYENAGVTPGQADRNTLVAALNNGGETRATVLRRIAESETLTRAESRPAFVLMQYVGYLRRNPDDLPDGNFDGYDFWLAKLNSFDGDFARAEMVKSFLVSTEYRHRFGDP